MSDTRKWAIRVCAKCGGLNHEQMQRDYGGGAICPALGADEEMPAPVVLCVVPSERLSVCEERLREAGIVIKRLIEVSGWPIETDTDLAFVDGEIAAARAFLATASPKPEAQPKAPKTEGLGFLEGSEK